MSSKKETVEFSNDQFKQLLDTIKIVNLETKNEIKAEYNKLEDQIRQDREEIKQEIRNENKKILEKLGTQDQTLNVLQQKYTKLEQRCLQFERQFRKNNIIIFGFEVKADWNLLNFVIRQIKELLDITLSESDINNIYVLKTTKSTPIKVEFASYLKKSLILKSAYKLKGKKIFLAQDLCFEDRQDNKILQQHFKAAREKNITAKIKNHCLIVNGEAFTVDRLRKIDLSLCSSHLSEEPTISENNVLPPRANSVPSTPLKNNGSEEVFFENFEIKSLTAEEPTQNLTEITSETSSSLSLSCLQPLKRKKTSDSRAALSSSVFSPSAQSGQKNNQPRLTRQNSTKDKNKP